LPHGITSTGDLGCLRLRRLVRQAVCQIGVNQAEDQFVLLGSHHGEAGTESPPFLGHARREVGCAGIALIFVASWNPLEACKDGIAHLLWNIVALPEAELHPLHGVWSHGAILSVRDLISRE
jgi:hypothetical protein